MKHDEDVRPGAMNLITDVKGLSVGQAEDRRVGTGVTVILPDEPAVAAVDVRGGGPGTRETDALAPDRLVQTVDAIVFSGGSAFGLDAAGGVQAWLAGKGRGYRAGTAIVPIVPSAILFDLMNEGDKDWGAEPPYRELGRHACDTVSTEFVLGRAGAGFGARAGALQGGTGSVSAVDPEIGATVGALAIVNSFGSVTMEDGCFYAWPFEVGEEFGGRKPTGATESATPVFPKLNLPRSNTTLVAVATDANLTRVQAQRIAVMAQDGIARAIRPAHTPYDGDTVFCTATGHKGEIDELGVARLGAIAADCAARAITRGVYEADKGLLQSSPDEN